MSVFRRRKGAADPDPDPDSARPDAEDPAVGAPEPAVGPYDVTNAPDDGLPRVDLGGLRVPTLQGVDVRVDVGPEGEVAAATLVVGAAAVQVGAFAAPKTSGIWDEVRDEILTSIRDDGGTAELAEGPFGTEIRALVRHDDGQRQPARFVGVDGPRWFLRGLFTGPAATDPAAAEPLEESLRLCVVNRGHDPMAVRDPLPLALPREVLQQAGALSPDADEGAQEDAVADDEVEDEAEDEVPTPPAAPRPPERGPEITETR